MNGTSTAENDGQSRSGSAVFVTTRWSVVVSAQGKDSPAAAGALEQLCQAYWYPLYAHVRRAGHLPADAEDLTQAFFARLLEKLSRELAMSEGAVRVAVHRLRRRYRELLREEIAQTVASVSEVEDELRQLFAALAG